MVKSKSSSGLGGPGLVIAALAAIGVWTVREPIDTGPAESSEHLPLALGGLERIGARLWEDPIQAVGRTLRREGISDQLAGVLDLSGGRPAGPQQTTPERLQLDEDWLVLTVFTHSGHQPENEEKRRRTRYAVQAAFSVENYAPVSGEHLGAFRFIPNDHPRCRAGGSQPPMHADRHLFPFERLRLRTSKTGVSAVERPENVLVIWVPEDELRGEALGVTHALLESLRELHSRSGAGPATYGFLGPTTTSKLLKFVQSDQSFEHTPSDGERCPFEEAVMISTWATAPSTSIVELKQLQGGVSSAEDEASRRRLVSRLNDPERAGGPLDPIGPRSLVLARSGLRIERGIGTDDELRRMLMAELDLRGVRKSDRIALLGEFGSTYSDSFVGEFTQSSETDPQSIKADSFAYPLGLDGSVPGEPDERLDSDLAEETFRERAVGRSQVDYVRRLQLELQGADYKAIGIVGTSVSDKLMLLRALRREFPHAILFTSDLDARFLQRSEYRYVRNLLIGSHFGLEPEHEDSAGARPLPFRDGYQTANYYAVRDQLRAFGARSPEAIMEGIVGALGRVLVEVPVEVLMEAVVGIRMDPPEPGGPLYKPCVAWLKSQIEPRYESALAWIDRLRSVRAGDGEGAGSDGGAAAATASVSRARLYEVGRTSYVQLSRKGELQPGGDFFRLSFPLLGVVGACLLVRLARVRRSLEAGTHGTVARRKASAKGLALGVLLIVVAGLTFLSAEGFWMKSAWSATRKASALGITTAGLIVVHGILAWGADERRRRSALIRIVAVSIPFAALCFLLTGVAIALLRGAGPGEPRVFLEGVNVWPTISVRIVVIICSIAAFTHLERYLRRGEREIARSFESTQRASRKDLGQEPAAESRAQGLFMIPPRRDASRSLTKARQWYETYSRQRVWRSSVFTLLFAVFLLFAYLLDRHDFAHARGRVAMEFERWTWGLSLLGIAWLIFLVADTTQLCRQLILPFCDRRPLMYWQNKELAPIGGVMPAIIAEAGSSAGEPGRRRRRMYPANLHPLMIMRYITTVTERVSRISWYPFTLLLVLILAQNGYVENWAWSWASAGLVGICILGALGATVLLRSSAERLRSFLLIDLREDMLRYKLKNDRDKLDEIEQAIEEIENTREGAFMPLREHPIVTAILLPFGGAGTVALLEVLNQ